MMTTIAYDGKTLAVDSMISGGYVSYAKKHFVLDDLVICGAGSFGDIKVWLDWFAGEAELKGFSDDKSFSVYVFCLKTGRLDMYDHYNPHLPVRENLKGIHAIGSGSEYAMGAMAAGKTAAEAVKIASKLDNYTGGKIYTFSKGQ